jgi:hypothetical protein
VSQFEISLLVIWYVNVCDRPALIEMLSNPRSTTLGSVGPPREIYYA